MSTPLVNGVAYSWSSVSFVLFGVPVAGIVNIEYKSKQTKTNNYGSGVEPVSMRVGLNKRANSAFLASGTRCLASV